MGALSFASAMTSTGFLPPCRVTTEIFRGISRKNEFSASENEFFREITRKIEVVTRQGGKNSGSFLLERFSNEVKMPTELLIHVGMSMEKLHEICQRRFIFGCRVRNFRNFLYLIACHSLVYQAKSTPSSL
jgi:hypothetical protein